MTYTEAEIQSTVIEQSLGNSPKITSQAFKSLFIQKPINLKTSLLYLIEEHFK